MKYILTIVLLTLTLQAAEPIKIYDKAGSDMKVWCFEGTKWLWAGSYNSPPVQILSAEDNHYRTVPKPIPCKD